MFRKFLKLVKLIQHPVYLKGLRQGVAGTVEHEAVIKYLQPKTVIDVGANKGQFALMALKNLPSVVVYSFEPISSEFNILEKVTKGANTVHCFNVALGSATKNSQIHVSNSRDSSSLLGIGATQLEMYPNTFESRKEEIRLETLDNSVKTALMEHPIFMKIDVQGYELEVIRGSTASLKNIDYIYVECSFVELYKDQSLAPEIIDELAKYQFELVGVYDTSYSKQGVAIQSDFLFKNISSQS